LGILWGGLGALLALFVVVGLVVAGIFGQISQEVSTLLDLEPWASASLTRAQDSTPEASSIPTGQSAHH
jgi:hypothetical protein